MVWIIHDKTSLKNGEQISNFYRREISKLFLIGTITEVSGFHENINVFVRKRTNKPINRREVECVALFKRLFLQQINLFNIKPSTSLKDKLPSQIFCQDFLVLTKQDEREKWFALHVFANTSLWHLCFCSCCLRQVKVLFGLQGVDIEGWLRKCLDINLYRINLGSVKTLTWKN